MKKILTFILSVLILLACVPMAFADDTEKTLRFNADGSFKILVLNDFQDTHNTSKKSLDMIARMLDAERPDLVVLNGDQLSDSYPFCSYDNFSVTIGDLVSLMERRQIPFLFTFGNHDADKDAYVPRAKQAELYYAYDTCYADRNGYDCGTYSKPILSSDGSRIALNIYMMDTGIWDSEGTVGGVTPEQVAWYKARSDELAELNGGSVVPSMLFQHIPVKETYQLLKEVPADTPGAVQCHFSAYSDKYYVLDESKILPSSDVSFKESVCSENPSRSTGEYEAWLEKGDIIGAIFAHDHMQNFLGRTDDGIILGYGRSCGFASYGDGDVRGGLVLEFNEEDVASYSFHSVTYQQLFPEDVPEDVPEEGEGDLLAFFVRIVNRFFTFFKELNEKFRSSIAAVIAKVFP